MQLNEFGEIETVSIRQKNWLTEFFPNEGGQVDSISRDGAVVLEVKQSLASTRGLHAAILQMAMNLSESSQEIRGILFFPNPRMSTERIDHEWSQAQRVLSSSIASRISVVAIKGSNAWFSNNDKQARRLARLWESTRQKKNATGKEIH